MTQTPAYASLTYRQTCELLCTLGGGRSGFDHKQFKLADLRSFIGEWIRQGAIDADQVDTIAQDILAAARAPAAPSVPPAPHAAVRAPVAPAAPSTQYRPGPAQVAPAPAADHRNMATVPILQHDLPAPIPAPVAPVAPAAIIPEPAPVAQAVQEVYAAPAPIIPAPVATVPAGTVQSVPVRELFADLPTLARHLPETLHATHYAHPSAPAVDPTFIYDPANLTQALIALASNTPIWCVGEKGTGKSQFVEQLAARLGRPFTRINFDRNLERAEFLGSMSLDNGSTKWSDGAMLMGARTPGCIILLDELSYGQQGNIAALNPILEPVRRFTVADTGETVQIAPGVTFFVADNTCGNGDVTGRYPGTHPLNSALVDRFGPMLRFDYLSEKQEIKLLVQRTDCPQSLAARIVAVLRTAREKATTGALADAPSLRRALFWASLMQAGVEPGVAFQSTVVEFAAIEAQEELRSIMRAVFKADDTGTAPVDAPGNPFTPAQ